MVVSLRSTWGAERSKFVLMDEKRLAEVKAAVTSGEAGVKDAAADLRKRADEWLGKRPPTVTDKTTFPVSGGKHDYMSLAIYFWPDPSKPGGKPYMSRDGVQNTKEIVLYDKPRIEAMQAAVRTLAMAYAVTGDEKYAEGATRYVRVWFLDEETKMNPNMEHAQFVPGQNEGRGIGLIETRGFVDLCDAVQMLGGSSAWTAKDTEGFKAWMNAYIDWILTSKNGNDELNAGNNHGEWCDEQMCGIGAYLGREDMVRKYALEAAAKITKQMEPDGSLPQELRRTKSVHYSLFALQAWMRVAAAAKPAGVDLYSWKDEGGRSVKLGLEYMAPYMLGEKKWEHQEIGGGKHAEYRGMFLKAAAVWGEPKFTSVADGMKGEGMSIEEMLATE